MKSQQTHNPADATQELIMLEGGLTKEQIRYLAANHIWRVIKTAFWKDREFHPQTVEACTDLLNTYFNGKESTEYRFKELCERVCLLKEFLEEKHQRLHMEPLDFINPKTKYGFSFTRAWYEQLQMQRRLTPFYKCEVRTFALELNRFIRSGDAERFFSAYADLLKLRPDLAEFLLDTVLMRPAA